MEVALPKTKKTPNNFLITDLIDLKGYKLSNNAKEYKFKKEKLHIKSI